MKFNNWFKQLAGKEYTGPKSSIIPEIIVREGYEERLRMPNRFHKPKRKSRNRKRDTSTGYNHKYFRKW